MKYKNCYEAMLRMIELSDKLSELLNANQKETSASSKRILSDKIDKVEMEFLTLKHSLSAIPYEEKKLTFFNL
ncbi:hypothetical protein JCM1393_26700 [Clostridium carnis]